MRLDFNGCYLNPFTHAHKCNLFREHYAEIPLQQSMPPWASRLRMHETLIWKEATRWAASLSPPRGRLVASQPLSLCSHFCTQRRIYIKVCVRVRVQKEATGRVERCMQAARSLAASVQRAACKGACRGCGGQGCRQGCKPPRAMDGWLECTSRSLGPASRRCVRID